MAVKKEIPYTEGVFFITFTCFKWMNLIDISNGYGLFYEWFNYLQKQGHFIVGYQIMPNHVHVIIGFRHCSLSINKIVGNGKRFIGYGIVKRLKEMGNSN